jgi:hypothetical protein
MVAFIFLSVAGAHGDDQCLKCHGMVPAAPDHKAAFVGTEVLALSIHAELSCVDCHWIDPTEDHAGESLVHCGECHQPEMENYYRSPHVAEREEPHGELPDCVACHSGHDVLAVEDPESRTSHGKLAKICITCHEDTKLEARHEKMPEPAMIRAYENSVHGRALLLEGNSAAPACVDCHGSHSFLPSDDPESPLTKPHISKTCGQCHSEIAQTYGGSVHGAFLAQGVLESPTCTNCHGEHNIRAAADPQSSVYATNVSKTCSDCHAKENLIAKFGLKPDRAATFEASFHGVAGELVDTRAANCASCHGVHNIYSQTDERSTINAMNIQSTCGGCHEDLPAEFARGTVHTSASSRESGGSYYVRKFYYWFIPVLIILFVAYRVLEYKRRVKRVE